jgi:tRNA(Ile)-lysidine synthase
LGGLANLSRLEQIPHYAILVRDGWPNQLIWGGWPSTATQFPDKPATTPETLALTEEPYPDGEIHREFRQAIKMLPEMLHRVEKSLALAWPPTQWRDVTVLLAVSGGADSVAMLRAVVAISGDARQRLAVAHLNHGLRGRQSDDDESFVAKVCRELSIRCATARVEVERLAARHGDGLEAAARDARYAFLKETAERLGARYVVTAHTADDQAETILHRIVRGTGIGGLHGMPRARQLSPAVTLIRPMLSLRRAQLVAYLDDLGQPYRSDPSNEDTRFTRNRIRHELLPQLAEQYNSGVVDALLRLGTLSGEVQSVVDKLVDELIERCVVRETCQRVRIDGAALRDQPAYVIRELLMAVWRDRNWPMQSMGFAQWELLADMVVSKSLPQTFPGEVLARKVDDHLILDREERQ